MDVLTFGEALVEIMRTGVDQPLHQPGTFTGPYPSGAPFIFAVQAARLGLGVGALGTVGDDAFGRCLREQLRVDGVDDAGLRVDAERATGAAFVAYNADGSRDFVFSLGAGGNLTPDMLDAADFSGLRCLHLMGSTLSLNDAALQTGLRALERARQHGATISFDPNIRPELLPAEAARHAFAPFLAAADVLLPTAGELVALTGAADADSAIAQLQQAKPGRLLVVTQGAQGCTVYSQSAPLPVPGYAVQEVDPTGAGDCFDAGFLAGWLGGETLHDAARWGNACGALAVTQQGPMAGAARRGDVVAFMQARR